MEAVLLLHGIWMHPVVFSWLSRQLKAQGYLVYSPAYTSVSRTPAQNASHLHEWIAENIKENQLHIIGHSLGGIVALHLLSNYPDLPSGRLVTLGSPVQGSCIARAIAPIPLLNIPFGHSMQQGLSGSGIPGNPGRDWGMVAGNKPLGLGSITRQLHGPHDGAVEVAETFHPAQTSHLTLPVNHTGLIFSTSVLNQSLAFLRTGQFSANH